MYIPGDLMISQAIQNDLLGTVRIPKSAMDLVGSRPAPKPVGNHPVCPTCLRSIRVA